MSVKKFFATIPLQPECNLNKTSYYWGSQGVMETRETRFPIIPILEANVLPGDNVQIVVIYTNSPNSENNIGLFTQELEQLFSELCMPLPEIHRVEIPYSEDNEKQIQLFRNLSRHYSDGDEVFIDITYGTKASCICAFSSLAYAEKACGCQIGYIGYGKFDFNTKRAELYDVRSLYEINMMAQLSVFIPKEKVKSLIDSVWGTNDA